METVTRDELAESFALALAGTEAVLPLSYCPCSGLRVAAGWTLPGNHVVTGTNYESASYGLTLCAERSALARAQVEGVIESGLGLVLTADWATSQDPADPLSPCGACRQWLAELSERLDRDFPVYSFWNGSATGLAFTARELLPATFDLKNLSQNQLNL